MGISKKTLLACTTLSLSVLLSLSLAGCGTINNNTKNEQKKEASATNLSSDKHINNASKELQSDNDSADTSISSEYYLSLGVLNENIIQNGAHRNESEVTVYNKRVLFPQGAIRSIAIMNWARKEKAYNPPKSEITQYVNSLENADIVEEIPENVLKNAMNIEMHIVYLNSHGEFRTITVTNFGDGYHEISIEKDDTEDFAKKVPIKSNTGEKYQQVFFRSLDIEKTVKSWINWEVQGNKGFDSIKSASLSADGKVNAINFTENQLRVLKKYLKEAKKSSESPCGYENHFECTQHDGSKFHFSISADGECISTDKSVYVVKNPENLEMVKLLKDIYKSTK
ncbi:MAG: hypothetical protein BHV87_04735 [Clostridiales bacterium 36_14]|nr:MAG: hypothetical protein BHV87_04735 [Clostridiales bacterium 36_14]